MGFPVGQCGPVRWGQRSPWTFGLGAGLAVVIGLACLSLGPIVPARAQLGSGAARPERPTPPVSLDMRTLLLSERVLADKAEGPVWTVGSRIGRKLIHLPILVTPRDEIAELDKSPIGVRGGRFIAWRIIKLDEGTGEDRRTNRSRNTKAARMGDSRYGYADDLNETANAGEQREQRWGSGQKSAFTLPDQAPRLARELIVLPNGRVRWEMDRAIPNADVREGKEDYQLRLRPQRFREMEPERPDLDRRNDESARAFAIRRRRAIQTYRNEARQFVERRKRVLDLPDTFETDMPEPVWAVFDVSEHYNDLTITGEGESLPWSIEFADLDMMRRFVEDADRGRDGGPIQKVAEVERMMRLAGRGHPLTLRLIAYTLSEANVVGRVQDGGPLYRLVQTIISGNDSEARQRMLKDLAATVPPTRATLSLLRSSAQHMDATTKLMSLRGMLKSDAENTAPDPEMIASADRLLADPEGPPPEEVLGTLINNIDGSGDVLIPATNGIHFGDLPHQRRDRAIAFVIQTAGKSALASNWLNHRLLGAADAQLTRRTLELLSGIDTGPNAVTPMVDTLFDAVLARRGEAAGSSAAFNVQLEAPLPLDSNNHALLRALASGNDQVYAMAWEALPHFRIPNPRADRRRGRNRDEQGNRGTASDEATRYQRVLEAALSRQTTPVESVAFFAAQPNRRRAAEALARLAVNAEAQTAEQAVRALHGSGMPIDQAMGDLPEGLRAGLAARVYQVYEGSVPLVVGLLRDERQRSDVAQWFGRALSEGRVPRRSQWADPYRDERDLLDLAGSIDTKLAKAAVAALVASAGGSTEIAEELAARFAQQNDRTPEGLAKSWQSAKKEIYTRRVANAAGTYRLVVQPPAEGRSSEKPKPIVLGVVDLIAQDGSIQLGRNQTVTLSVPSDKLAIRMDNPNELKNFPNKRIAELPLERIDGAMDLRRQSDGTWQGAARMGDEGELTVSLEPVN